MRSMPTLPVERMIRDLPTNSARIIRAAFRQSDGPNATLRATKPFRKINPKHPCAMFEASANYVWRALCLEYAPRELHYLLPVTAGFDLYMVLKGQCDHAHQATRDMMLVLDQQIKLAGAVIPVTAQRGVMS